MINVFFYYPQGATPRWDDTIWGQGEITNEKHKLFRMNYESDGKHYNGTKYKIQM